MLEGSLEDSRRTPNLDQTRTYACDQETDDENDDEEDQATDDQNEENSVLKQAKSHNAKAKLNKDLPF